MNALNGDDRTRTKARIRIMVVTVTATTTVTLTMTVEVMVTVTVKVTMTMPARTVPIHGDRDCTSDIDSDMTYRVSHSDINYQD